jgi:hypothetical protein
MMMMIDIERLDQDEASLPKLQCERPSSASSIKRPAPGKGHHAREIKTGDTIPARLAPYRAVMFVSKTRELSRSLYSVQGMQESSTLSCRIFWLVEHGMSECATRSDEILASRQISH